MTEPPATGVRRPSPVVGIPTPKPEIVPLTAAEWREAMLSTVAPAERAD
ncbi:hypothetical protein QI633_17625 [Nocardioides sp. QY071]|nr:hypothetical protein [Nocardioides sp. QY071]WGY00353.1 hypothetical protein QI633_17625 [Nocardioides sp. QY071]